MIEIEVYELGERALRAGFKWAPGCVAVSSRKKYGPAVYLCPDHDGKPMFCCLSPGAEPAAYDNMVPDVRDSGVIGQLWAQLAERTGTHIEIRRSSDGAGWSVGPQDGIHSDFVGMECSDLSDALVAALEMAHMGGF